MATDKVVKMLRTGLDPLIRDLDQSLDGLSLCMIFQQRHAIDPRKWILCVSAKGLDELTRLAALKCVLGKLEEDCDPETAATIERVSILRTDDPATTELLLDAESVADGRLLIGRSVFGRTIARAHILLIRDMDPASQQTQEAMA